ncbi:hypothetical protein [Arthrobacter sp. NPDC057013]|uniref:hypothetical protein n=1 Tax=Arthrobacter sp. NPDC057013 TaxID=3345999 RepID=UPI00363663A7
MALSNYPDWNRLIGATVEIRLNGHMIRIETVDDAMPDSSALWLAAGGAHARTLYEAALRYEAWVEPPGV